MANIHGRERIGLLTALFLFIGLFGQVLTIGQPARADWYPGCGSYSGCSTDYASDYVGAACEDMYLVYPGSTDCTPVGFGYTITGQLAGFTVSGYYGPIAVNGYSVDRCSSTQIRTATGCADESDDQGDCGCGADDSGANGPPDASGDDGASNGNPSDVGGDGGTTDENGGSSVGDPINISTGNVFEQATDFKTVGQDPLTSTRFYNSDQNYTVAPQACYTGSQPANLHGFLYSRFGYGWRGQFDNFIVPRDCCDDGCVSPTSATYVDTIRPDGTPVHFNKSGGVWYVQYYNITEGLWQGSSTGPRSNIDIQISEDGTYWYITDSHNTVEKYNASGQLISITYRNGYQQTLAYDANNNNTVVSDSFGRQITFGYLANGLVSSMTDTANNVTHYSYIDRSGVSPAPASGAAGLWALSTVTYPDTTSRTYSYTDPNVINRLALTGITDEDGNAYGAWTYDSTTGRATSSQHAGGAGLTSISYNDTAVTRTVTNALGKQTIYSLASHQNVLRVSSAAGQASPNTAAATVSYTYDTNGYVNQMTTGEGRVTTYTHSAIGQETSRTEGYGTSSARTITTTWDSTYNLPDKTVEPNLTYNFTYSSGLLTQLTETDTTTQSVPYTTNGQTRTWSYAYYTNGLLNTVTGPLGTGDTVTYAYNTNGFVNSVTDQLGHVTQITAWNVWGEPLTSVDPNSVTTNYSYDLRARLKSITVNPGSNQAVTSLTYDNAGNLTCITRPDSSSLTYGYDAAHRLTSITNNLGEAITYTLDAAGDRTQTTVKSSAGTITKTQTATYDELARLLQSIGASSQTTTYAYDRDNNRVSVTDPRSKLYQNGFDAIERVIQQTDPDSYHTGIAYNGKDDVTGLTDARSLSTSYVRDGFGDIIQQTSPDTGATTFWYDAHGNVTKKVDARSIETDFTYDALNRVLTRTFPADTAENVTYSYDSTASGNDGIGRLTSVTDQSGSTGFTYNALGQSVTDSRIIGTNTYSTSYTFDPAGHPLTTTYPSGRIVTFTLDGFGRIASIATQQSSSSTAVTVLSGATYEPYGALAGANFGNGISLAVGYDEDYELTSIASSLGSTGIQNLSYGYDPAGNITSITDNLASSRSQTFTYDDLNRIWSASGLYGAISYTYDGVGNRLSETSGSTTGTYAYSSTANQISTVTTGTNVRTFGYLASGQASGDQRTPASNYGYTFNNDGRLQAASANGSNVGTYLYNGFEQRVQKTVGTTVTDFVYDRFGHLLVEANDATGAPIREYVWLDDTPVAMVDDTGSSPVLYYIHADHLGRPQKLTDASGNIAWDGVFDPFGNLATVSGSAAMLLMFPGQYYDSETQLSQNWHRDYDPTLGRYTESDPIGLRGGKNTYAYAGQSPLLYVDAAGLAIGDLPPAPPGYNPGTWGVGKFEDGTGFLIDPDGNVYLPHAEDEGHWRHWDIQNDKGKNMGTCPANAKKPWPGQKKPPYNGQSGSDPSGNAPPMTPPVDGLFFAPVPNGTFGVPGAEIEPEVEFEWGWVPVW